MIRKKRLDWVLRYQVHLVANKIKMSKEEFKKKYNRCEKLILAIDKEFYNVVKLN